MTPHAPARPDDDPAFRGAPSRIISGVIAQREPEGLHLIRINNWFDHKWLRFSGKGSVPHDGSSIETYAGGFRQTYLTFPPFTPNRVASQRYF